LSGEAWYFFQNPEDCSNSKYLNDALPVLMSNTDDSRFKGWGIYIEQRYSILPIFIPALVLILTTVGATVWFIFPWLKDHPDDLQNATVPLVVTFSIIGICIQILMTLLIFRWST
jgi:hypothetical protein